MKKVGFAGLLAAASVGLAMVAGAAQAVPYVFVLSSPHDGFSPNYTWMIDSSPVVSGAGPVSFNVDGVVESGDRPVFGHFQLVPMTITFFTEEFDGGFLDGLLNFVGPQLFSGATSAPTFLTGTFALDDGTSLTISGPAGGAPEPAAWSLMLLGFGGVGLAVRRRRQGLPAAG